VELTELMRDAQEAMDRSDYQVATLACMHVLDAYPSCLTAHRVLGEAHLERGEADLATKHFDSVLEIDPLNVVARLGLGVAAEERQDPTTAYTHYLNAWEINPALEQVREELVRLRIDLGREDRLHPTRAGLASIYTRGGQLGRAAAEWRALLHADPENVRNRSALAEVLWRAGDDAGAAAAAKTALETAPYNARLLAILADIERRQGTSDVGKLVERYRDADPLGDVVSGLADLRPGVELEFLRPGPLPIEPFDFNPQAVSAPEPPAYAPGALAVSHLPAPDLWDNLIRDFDTDLTGLGNEPVGEVVPFAWEDALGSHDQSLDGSILGDAVMPAGSTVGPEPASLGESQAVENLNQLFAAQSASEAIAPDQAESDPFPFPQDDLSALMAEQGVPETIAAAIPADELAALMAMPTSESTQAVSADAAFTSVLPDLTLGELPSSNGTMPTTEKYSEAAVAEAPNPFITADGRVDLTVGWDELDRTLAEATPSGDVTDGYEHLLAEIDAGGIAPFAAAEPAGDSEAWEPFTDDDVPPDPRAVAPEPVVAAAPVEALEVAAIGDLEDPDLQLAVDWGIEPEDIVIPTLEPPVEQSSFSDDAVIVPAEVATSIQLPGPSGYTEIFRNIDQDSLLFPPEEPPVNPLANPDIAGEPPDLSELLAVASNDSSDLASEFDEIDLNPSDALTAEEWFAGVEARVAEPVAAVVGSSGQDSFDPLISDLQGIEPFSFDDGSGGGLDGELAIDFSEVNEAPFDPAQYQVMPDLGALHDTMRPAIPVPPIEDDGALEPIDDELALELAAIEGASETEINAEAANSEESDEERLLVADVHRSWPAFVGMTSELIDRGRGGLFERLRSEKGALVDAGVVTVSPRVAPEVLTPAASIEAVAVAIDAPVLESSDRVETDGEVKAPMLSVVVANNVPDHGLDLAALRDRLLESDAAAREVAEQLETAVSRGTSDPALLRALGEAYLKVGKSEQAAAQFRRAMLARRRAQ
jgi:Tfp pilus assembly protein PilF